MKSHAVLALGISLALAIGCRVAVAQDTKTTSAAVKPVYSVESYDPKRDAAEDLKQTIAKAKPAGKRILVQVGGDWCGWCHLMNKYFHENEKVATALQKDFIIQKVNYSEENRNEVFLSKYPKVKGYPHLFVLESDGTLLHSQDTSELEEGKGYNERVVLEFLAKWAPKK
jgi:thiol:disulfide interchange protein